MKASFVKTVFAIILCSLFVTASAQTKQEQKRLRAIEKSIKQKSVEVYDDTAYYKGAAVCLIDKSVPFILKNRKRVLLGIKSGKKLVTMSVAMVGTFKLEFEGVKDAGVIQEKDFDAVMKYLLDENILKDGELEVNAASAYVSKNTCIEFAVLNASLTEVYIKVGTKSFLLNAQSETMCAGKAGDKVLMYESISGGGSSNTPLSSVPIEKNLKRVSVNKLANALVAE